jgi:DEAD/DEAH box helicase domain-containing protein
MSLETALQALRRDAGFMRNVTAWQPMPARAARTLPLPADLHPALAAALRSRGIDALYSHQAAAWQAARAGHNLVVATATASGKTLCYNLPVAQALLTDSSARALYLFPTKALAQDQLAELAAIQLAIDNCQLSIVNCLRPATYDGDTPQRERGRVRREARIVLSNPDMLHTGILPHHPQWAELLGGLRYVVLDELHTYRGVFGSHVANVLRRLQRICRFYGSNPRFLCTSATLANPQELAQRLIEAPVTLLDDDGSPQGERHFVFYNPPVVDPSLGLRRSSLLESEAIAATLLAHDVQTVVFARSRLSVEVLLTYLRERAGEGGKGGKGGKGERRGTGADLPGPSFTFFPSFPSLPSPIAGYRGGYLPLERRKIEQGLRNGAVRAVVSTNALELGIDIGGLDAAVLVGYPGAIASTWQQAGRAGRQAGVSLAVLVASASALDQYIVTHPEYVLARSPEHGLINPDNLAILASHLACAAFELPFRGEERFGQVAFTDELLACLAETGDVQQHGGDWFWMGEGYPAQAISLRTASPDNVVIHALDATRADTGAGDVRNVGAGSPRPPGVARADTGAGEPRPYTVIGQLERAAAPALLHPGAVYLHQGQSYLVERLDWDAGQAWVRPANVDYYTMASGSQQVQVLGVQEQRAAGGLGLAYGPVQVVSQVSGYRQVKRHTHETLGYGEIQPALPEQVLETDAFWLALDEELLAPLRAAGQWRSDPNDYGPNWQQQRNAARARDGYRCTLCGVAEHPGRQHDVHHRLAFRSFGYIPGQNEAYRQANQLENLATLCRTCHQRAEQGQRLRTGLGGLAYALGSLAPLHLMCDPGDIGVAVEPRAPGSSLPTITIYEKAPAGIGFSQRLYELAADLVAAASDLAVHCGCAAGCPACVGPVGEDQQADIDARQLTLALADACRRALRAEPAPACRIAQGGL